MKSLFCISDVHLKKMASPHGEAILALLDRAIDECSHFIILGDLFDLWLGSGEVFQKEFHPLIRKFKKLREVCEIYYFEGNHDLHLDPFWKNSMHFKIFKSHHMISFGKYKIWAEHGDEINRQDKGYLFLRRLLRSKPMEILIKNTPSQFIFEIGNRASRTSRNYTKTLKWPVKEIFRSYAFRTRLKSDFDFMLVGHSHVPDHFEFEIEGKPSHLINLGSWLEEPQLLVISDSEFKILKGKEIFK